MENWNAIDFVKSFLYAKLICIVHNMAKRTHGNKCLRPNLLDMI
jgi:hypothetical protein